MKVMLVLSGGQDSTTCLFWCKQRYDEIHAVGFDYGQRHIKELELAGEICETQQIPFQIIDLKLLSQLAPNALTDTKIAVDSQKPKDKPPNTFVEGRNLLFLTYAAIAAKQKGITDIVTGVCQTDFSGYPDCRDEFIKSLEHTLCLAMDYPFKLITPLMWLNKSQIWGLADKLGCIDIIKNKTLTCYNGIQGEGCKNCPACTLRIKGYLEYLSDKNA